MTAHDFLYGFSRYYRTKSDWHLDLDFARDIPVPGRRTSGNDVYDGIVSDATVLDAKLLSRSGPDTRIVLFGDLRADLDGRKIAYVQTDDTAIGRLGAQNLLSLGNFMSFGYVPVANESKWSARRGRGFAEALSEAGRSCVSFRGKDEAEIDSYLRGLPKPAAVLCACDAVARALLDLRFRQFARSSVRAEIEAARLEAVRRKLLSTALPIKTIAASCGYKGAAHLGAIFRRRFGITMSECRAKR